jgi:hypothetical protein
VVFTQCRSREQFLIRWDSNGLTKWVNRLNLLFTDDSRAGFQLRVRQARRRRHEVSSTAS